MLPKELIDWLEANAEVHDLEAAAAPEQIEPIPCSKFSDLCETLRDDGFILSEEGEDVFAIMLATHLSTTLPGPPLWVYLIGAPSAGKTTYLSFIEADLDHVHSAEKLTGLHSGMKGTGDEKHKDFSLVPKFNGKTVCVKEGTVLLTMSHAVQEAFYGELRGIFDGAASQDFKNGINRRYKGIKFSMLIGVTHIIDTKQQGDLGERFLKIELPEIKDTVRSRRAVSRIMDAFKNRKAAPATAQENFPIAKATCLGLIQHKQATLETWSPPDMSSSLQKKMSSLADIICVMRALVHREGGPDADPSYKPAPEASDRLAESLTKMCLMLSFVLDRSYEKVFPIVKRLAWRTANSYRRDMIEHIMARPSGITREGLAAKMDISLSKVTRMVDDLRRLHAVTNESRPNNSGVGGRNAHLWRLTPKFKSLIDSVTT